MKKDLKVIIKKYGGQWIALNEDMEKVVANGKNVKKVFSEASKKSAKIPYLFKVPTQLKAYIG